MCQNRLPSFFIADFQTFRRIDRSRWARGIQSCPQKVQTLLCVNSCWISICHWLTSGEKTNNKKHWGGMNCDTNATLSKMSDSIVSLPLLAVWASVSNTGISVRFQEPLQPELKMLKLKTSLDDEKQSLTTHKTDGQAEINLSDPLMALEWSLWADPVYATMCVRFYVCVRVSARWTFSVE